MKSIGLMIDRVYRLSQTHEKRYMLQCRSRKGAAFFYYKEKKGMETREERLARFKTVSSIFLYTMSSKELQIYGRMLQLKDPTRMKKREIVQAIIGVYCGEIVPEKRSKKGAPIKNVFVNPIIAEKMEAYKKNILHSEEEAENESEQSLIEEDQSLLEEEQPLSKKEEASPVTVKLEVRPSALTTEQRQLFNDFLNSL